MCWVSCTCLSFWMVWNVQVCQIITRWYSWWELLFLLMRNIDHYVGLWNGTILIITKFGNHIIKAKILTGNSSGEIAFIPKTTLILSDIHLFQISEKTIPFILSYTINIKKSRGQSLSHVGILLKKSVSLMVNYKLLFPGLRLEVDSRYWRLVMIVLVCTHNVVYKETFKKEWNNKIHYIFIYMCFFLSVYLFSMIPM